MATSEIRLRVDTPYRNRPNNPIVTVLVDGQEFLPESLHGEYMGFDPREILGPDQPLMPTTPARRVAVYRCSCGEPGCGCVAPVISEEGRVVIWSDFQDFTGVYGAPLTEGEATGGHDLGLRRIVFDAAQYRAEVERAHRDLSWETQARTTARLLRESLETDTGLEQQGYKVGWVSPKWDDSDSFELSLRDAQGSQILVALTPKPGPPEQQSREMAETMLHTEPSEWSITFHSGRMGRLERRRFLRRLRRPPAGP